MNLRIRIILLLTAIIAIVSLGCGSKGADESNDVVIARVNDAKITVEDFAVTMDLLYYPSERPKFTTPEGRKSLLNLMTFMELFRQEGHRQKLDTSPHVERVMENFKRYLVYYTLVTENITPETMNDYYQRNYFHVAVIFISKPQSADAGIVSALRAKAEGILDSLNKGADFAQAAAQYSDHPSRKNGGDPGPISFNDNWPIQVLRGAATLRTVGEISKLIETPEGFYILKLVELYGKLNVANLPVEMQEVIFNTMFQANVKTYMTQLQALAKIETFPELLDKIEIVNPMQKGAQAIPTVPPPGMPVMQGAGAQ